MKFSYEYRSRDNVKHRGDIDAANREAVYSILRAKGIKPSLVVEAPGFFNKLLGKGKRWIAIAILAVALAIACLYIFVLRTSATSEPDFVSRQQIYGDPSILQAHESVDWADVFKDAGDRVLAAYAQPGRDVPSKVVVGVKDISVAPVAIEESDGPEVAKMKRIVNGMKSELASYLKAGGTVSTYLVRLQERQSVEKNIRLYKLGEMERLKRMVEVDRVRAAEHWDKLNAELRSFGLQTQEMPDDFL